MPNTPEDPLLADRLVKVGQVSSRDPSPSGSVFRVNLKRGVWGATADATPAMVNTGRELGVKDDSCRHTHTGRVDGSDTAGWAIVRLTNAATHASGSFQRIRCTRGGPRSKNRGAIDVRYMPCQGRDRISARMNS